MSRAPVTTLAMMIRYDLLSASVTYVDFSSDVTPIVILFTNTYEDNAVDALDLLQLNSTILGCCFCFGA